MRVAILGYGTVGGGVGRIIAEQQNQTQQLTVTHIFVRPTHPHTEPTMSSDFAAIIADPDLDVVVETLGGIEPAHEYILAALRHGKHVVTANKAVVARYLKEFTATAAANHVHFYYEASTGGGIPWLRNLEQATRVDDLDELAGIFNGTSNYILDQMQSRQEDFGVALKSAQELGYAEADPTADIAGIDVQNKLRISTAIAFDVDPAMDIPTLGIEEVQLRDIRFLQQHGLTVKLMGRSVRRGQHFASVIEPTVVANDSLEAHTPGNFNLIALKGRTVGPLKFYGQGAGALPTANAIVQDILDIMNAVPHVARRFDHALTQDESLLRGDYLIRGDGAALAQASAQPVHNVGGDYHLIEDVEPDQMHKLVRSQRAGTVLLRLAHPAMAERLVQPATAMKRVM